MIHRVCSEKSQHARSVAGWMLLLACFVLGQRAFWDVWGGGTRPVGSHPFVLFLLFDHWLREFLLYAFLHGFWPILCIKSRCFLNPVPSKMFLVDFRLETLVLLCLSCPSSSTYPGESFNTWLLTETLLIKTFAQWCNFQKVYSTTLLPRSFLHGMRIKILALIEWSVLWPVWRKVIKV